MTSGKPIRVLHVTRIPRTITAFLMPLLREHQRRGDDVAVACGDAPEAESIEREGIRVHRYRLDRSLAPWNLVGAVRDLRRIMQVEQIDWLFTHTPIASGVARIAARRAGLIGTVYMAHGLPCAPQTPTPLRWLWYLVERKLARNTSGLITMNRYDFELVVRKRLLQQPGNILLSHGVGVDVEQLDGVCRSTSADQVRESLGLPVHRPMVLFLGRTVRTKGVWEYLQAARRLLSEGCEAAWVMAGEGRLDRAIAGYIRKHELETSVRFLGWRRDAHRLLAACDLFVLPSYYPEGLPVSILEAMACGKPVVTTRTRGCEDLVVNDVTGLLIEPGNVDALARAVRQVIENPAEARRFGDAGRRRVEDHFRVEKCTREIMAAFDQIVGRGPDPSMSSGSRAVAQHVQVSVAHPAS